MAKAVNMDNDDDLVVRARRESEALSRLYELYYEPILRFCVHRLFDRTTAEDVTSTVFLAVARGVRSFEGRTLQDFRNWVYAIATNQCNAHIRRSSRRRRLLALKADTMSRKAESGSDRDRGDWPELYRAIMKLKPQHQTIVTLRFFENFGYDEIAEILGSNPQAVRVAVHRVLRRLQKMLRGRL